MSKSIEDDLDCGLMASGIDGSSGQVGVDVVVVERVWKFFRRAVSRSVVAAGGRCGARGEEAMKRWGQRWW